MTQIEDAQVTGEDESLVEQLHSVYAEQAHLQAELGTSNTEELIAILTSLEKQLIEFYRDRDVSSAQ